MELELKVCRGTVNLLSNLLSKPNWYEGNVAVAYAAGKLLTAVLPDLSQEQRAIFDGSHDGEQIKKWLSGEVVLKMTDEQREAMKKCVAFHLSKSLLPMSAFALELMQLLGLAGKEA